MSVRTPILCVVCLETTTPYPNTLPCGHKFHKHCIRKWAKLYNSCPICRKAVNKNKPIVNCISSFITDDDRELALALHRRLNGIL
jgi:hypothetical protein